jgi:hypothetical protein
MHCCCSLCQSQNFKVVWRHPGQFLWPGCWPLLSTKTPHFTRGMKSLQGCNLGCLVGWKPFAAIAPEFFTQCFHQRFYQCLSPAPPGRETHSRPPPLQRETHTHSNIQLIRRLRRRCWPPSTCRSHPSPTTNLRCACDRFCDPPRPCLNVCSPHVCER